MYRYQNSCQDTSYQNNGQNNYQCNYQSNYQNSYQNNYQNNYQNSHQNNCQNNGQNNVEPTKEQLHQYSAITLLVKYPHLYHEVKHLMNSGCFLSDKARLYYECFSCILERGGRVDMASIQDYYISRGLSALFTANADEINGNLGWFKRRDTTEETCRQHICALHAQWYKNHFVSNMSMLLNDIASMSDVATSQQVYDRALEFLKGNQPAAALDEKPESADAAMTDVIDMIERGVVGSKGVDTGFTELQKMCNGFSKGTVTCFLSRMKEGKSMLLMNMGIEAARKGTPVLLLDTEMTRQETFCRIIAKLSGVPTSDIKSGAIRDNDQLMTRVRSAIGRIPSNRFWWMSVAGKSVDQYVSIINKWVTENVGFDSEGQTKECLVIFDYMKLTSGDIRDNMREQEWRVLGDIATKIKETAVKMGVPVLTAIQANREYVKTGAGTSTVSGSDRVSMYVDTLIDYSSKDDIELAEDNMDVGPGSTPGTKKMKVLISRNAEPTKQGNYLSIIFDGATSTVQEYAMRSSFRKMDIPTRSNNGKIKIGKQPKKTPQQPLIQQSPQQPVQQMMQYVSPQPDNTNWNANYSPENWQEDQPLYSDYDPEMEALYAEL